MADLNDIAALERDFDEMAYQAIQESGIEMMQFCVAATFEHIMDVTPVWSGYAAANIRIGLGGLEDAELDPASRAPSPPSGLYEALIPITRAEELAKLDDVQFAEPVEIGVGVAYYTDIAWTPNKGADIFNEAAIVGPEIGQGRFNSTRS